MNQRTSSSFDLTSPLWRASEALLRSVSSQNVCDIVLEIAMDAMQSDAGSIYLMSRDGSSVELAGTRGLSPRDMASHEHLDLGLPSPGREVVRTMTPLWVSSLHDAERDLPHPLERTRSPEYQAWALLPLAVDTICLGLLGLYFHEPRPFSSEQRAFLLTLAGQGAQALERTRLYTELRHRADRFGLLLQAARTFAESTGDLPSVLGAIVRRASEVFGDSCILWLRSDDDEWLEPTASFHVDPMARALLQKLGRQRTSEGLNAQVLASGETLFLPRFAATHVKALSAQVKLYVEHIPIHGTMIAPLRRHGQIIGTLVVSRNRVEPCYTLDDKALLEHLADLAAVSIENARLVEAERRARDALAVERATLRAVVDQMPAGVMLAEATTGRVILANREVARILGAASGRRIPESEPPESPYKAVMARALEHGHITQNQEIEIEQPDGTHATLLTNAGPVLDSQDQIIAGVVAFVDITERKRLERHREMLAEASRQLGESLDYDTTLSRLARLAVPWMADWASVHVMDPDGSVRQVAVAHVNPAREHRAVDMGERFRLAQGNPIRRLLRGESGAFVIADITDRMLERAAVSPEHLAYLRSLACRSTLSVPVRWGNQVLAVLSFATAESGRRYDVRDVALAEELAQHAGMALANARLYQDATQARRQAEEANRAKDEFLAMLGHELRNPLSPILTAVELMRLQAPDMLVRERATIERQARHMTRLVDDLLDLSRITRRKITLQKRPMELAEVVAKAIETASPALEQRGHELSVLVPRAGLLIEVDEYRLAQVMANLLINAAKYTEPGGAISITGKLEGERVMVKVRDNGIGLAPELLPHVFDAFVQGRYTIDRSQGGLGVGLAIARNLVEMHGGTIAAASEGPGKGSEFVIQLPCAASPMARSAASRAEPAGEPAHAPVTVPAMRQRRVLVVDDNRDAATLLADALALLGHDTLVALDGPQALAMVARDVPDLIIVDIGLPIMDGYELARRIRALAGLDRVPLLAVSGYGQVSDMERSRSAGFAEHLVKPVDLENLARLVVKLTR